MPQRPRSHQLEEESRRAFRAAVPSIWVVQDHPDDYGVDIDVEIFENDGTATGMSFAAQLRGTDVEDLKVALSVRIRRSTVRYLRQLDVPALLVRYHAKSGALYYRWLHQLAIDEETPSETITVHMTQEDIWTDATPSQVRNQVSAMREWKAREPSLPLEVLVRAIDPQPELSAAGLALVLRTQLAASSDLVTFTSSPYAVSSISLIVSREYMKIDVLGMASFAWTHGTTMISEDDRARCVMLQIALVLNMTGKESLAARFLNRLHVETTLVYDLSVALAVGWILGSTNNVDIGLRIARDLMTVNEHGFHASRLIEHGLFLAVGPQLGSRPHVAAMLEAHLGTLLEVRSRAPNAQESLSRVHYSLANLLFNLGRYRESLYHLRLASTNDIAYRTKDYWWAETAAALFELGRYRLSNTFYQCAEDLSEDPYPRRVRRADALMHLGQYAEASQLFGDYIASDLHEREPLWLLNAGVLHQIVNDREPPDQRRRPDAAAELIDSIDTTAGPQQVIHSASHALEVDFLCHKAWHYIAAAADQLGDAKSQSAALMALVTDPNCLDSYLMVIKSAAGQEDFLNVVAPVIEFGYVLHGDSLLTSLLDDFRQALGHLPPEIPQLLETIVEEARQRPRLPTISRIW